MVETEDEWIDKAEEERRIIIAKYDKGREDIGQIDPWDDPGFEIYHVTDFYGFIHDNRLPNIGADDVKKRNHEVERTEKWLKMHKLWEKYKSSEKLKKRTYKGIPNKVRGLFWSLLLDLEPLKEQQKGKYKEMYDLARKYSPDIRQIDLDVNRTYRDHVFFRERYGSKQQSLFNILSAYSIYNSEVGYCQGMSQIAALLLLYLNEEDAFWGLAQLMTHHKYAMHGFFIAGFPKLVRFQSHHDKVLSLMLPKLKKHFDKHGVDSGLYTLKWFFQCFLDRVPYEIALRLWDVYLLEGERVLICGAYAILKMHNKSLLSKKNMDDILTYIQSKLPNNFDYDADQAIKNFGNCVEELHRKKLDTAGEPGDEELVKKPFGVIDNSILQASNPKNNNANQPKTKTTSNNSNKDSSSSPIKKPIDEVENNKSRISPIHSNPSTPVPENNIPENNNTSTIIASTTTPSESPTHLNNQQPTTPSVDGEIKGKRIHLSPTKSMEFALENNSTISSSPIRQQPIDGNVKPVRIPPKVSPRTPRNQQSQQSPQPNQPHIDSHRVHENTTIIIKSSTTTTSSSSSLLSSTTTTTTNKIPPSVSPRHYSGIPVVENNIPSVNNSSSSSSTSRHSPGRNVEKNKISSSSQNQSFNAKTTTSALYTTRSNSTSPSPSANKMNIPIVESSSIVSTQQSPSISNIPNSSGETVRIHVPYNTSSTRHSFETTPTASRNGFDLSKSDPNRIKIDVSSGSGSGILG